MSDDIIHAVAEILGMSDLAEFDATRSVINENFNDKRKRLIDKDDYDELKRENKNFR